MLRYLLPNWKNAGKESKIWPCVSKLKTTLELLLMKHTWKGFEILWCGARGERGKEEVEKRKRAWPGQTCLAGNRVRTVIDVESRYYLASEYLECLSCNGTFIAYNSRLTEQLPDALKFQFPTVLKRKFATDKSVVAMMRARTLGNSPTATCNDISELHSEEWMQSTVMYLSDCDRHKRSRESLKLPASLYENLPAFTSLLTAKWFLATYVRDVWSWLDSLKASMTSVYGCILKIDSTKKITKKLQRKLANSASWCTNLGKERGEVLVSLLTTSESCQIWAKWPND